MKNIFTPNSNAKRQPCDVFRHHNTATYSNNSLTALRPKIWNKLPTKVKLLTSVTKFKEYIRMRFWCCCKCNVCRMFK